jgi:hypothetical protein
MTQNRKKHSPLSSLSFLNPDNTQSADNKNEDSLELESDSENTKGRESPRYRGFPALHPFYNPKFIENGVLKISINPTPPRKKTL